MIPLLLLCFAISVSQRKYAISLLLLAALLISAQEDFFNRMIAQLDDATFLLIKDLK